MHLDINESAGRICIVDDNDDYDGVDDDDDDIGVDLVYGKSIKGNRT